MLRDNANADRKPLSTPNNRQLDSPNLRWIGNPARGVVETTNNVSRFQHGTEASYTPCAASVATGRHSAIALSSATRSSNALCQFAS